MIRKDTDLAKDWGIAISTHAYIFELFTTFLPIFYFSCFFTLLSHMRIFTTFSILPLLSTFD